MASTSQTLRVRITGQVQGLVKAAATARAAVRSVGDGANQGIRPLRGLTDSLVRVAGVMRAVSTVAKPALVTAAIPGVLGLAAALGQAAGAGLLLPGALLAIASVVAPLKIALGGFGEALRNVGDPEKFAEATAKLTPAARAAAEAVRDLKAPFDELRNSLRQRLFTGLAPQIKAVGSALLSNLRPAFEATAASANAAISGVLTDLASVRRQADISGIVGDSTDAFDDLFAAVRPLVGAFIDIGAVGAGFLPVLTEGAGAAAQSFADMIARMRESGQLQQIISGGLSALGDLATIAGNVGSILGGVFTAANGSGAGFLGTLKEITGSLAEVVNSAAGQQALGAFFGTIATVAQTVGEVLRTLAPVIATVLQGVQAGVSALAPAIQPLAAAFGEIVTALAPLLPLVGQVAGLFAGVLATALTALAPGLSALVTALSGALQPILTALAPVLTEIATTLGTVLADAVIALAPLLTELGPVLAQVAAAIGEALIVALQALAPLLPQIVGGIADLAIAVLPLLPAIADLLPPVADLIAALAPLVGVLLDVLIPVLTTVAHILTGVLGVALAALGIAVNNVKVIVETAFGIIAITVRTAIGIVSDIFNGFAGYFRSLWDGLFGFVTNIVKAIGALFRGDFGAARDFVVAAFRSLVDGASGAIGSLLSMVSGIGGRILGALGDLGSLLYNAGKNVIQGLIDGILAMLNAVRTAAGRVAGAVRDALPFSPARYGPLRTHPPDRAGRTIVDMLAAGLIARQGRLRDTMARLATSLTSPGQTTLAAALAGGARIVQRFEDGSARLSDGRVVDAETGLVRSPVRRDGTAGELAGIRDEIAALVATLSGGLLADIDWRGVTLRVNATNRDQARR